MTSILPLLPVLLIIGTDFWVYQDCAARLASGTPVVATFGGFRLDGPAQWVVACTFFWVIFFPVYLVARRR